MSDPQLKNHAPKTALHWGGPPVIALVTTLLTGYFSAQESKIKASIEIAGINAKTGVSYDVLSKAVTTLESTVKDQDRASRELASQVSELQGALKTLLEHGRVEIPPTRPTPIYRIGGSSGLRGSGGLTLISPEKLFGPKPKSLDLPNNIDEAVQRQGPAAK